jgi:hypothetical protein
MWLPVSNHTLEFKKVPFWQRDNISQTSYIRHKLGFYKLGFYRLTCSSQVLTDFPGDVEPFFKAPRRCKRSTWPVRPID